MIWRTCIVLDRTVEIIVIAVTEKERRAIRIDRLWSDIAPTEQPNSWILTSSIAGKLRIELKPIPSHRHPRRAKNVANEGMPIIVLLLPGGAKHTTARTMSITVRSSRIGHGEAGVGAAAAGPTRKIIEKGGSYRSTEITEERMIKR